MTSQEMVLDFLRWELEQVLATRNAVFQRAAILIGLVGVSGALLASAVPAIAGSPRDFPPFGFGMLTVGLLLVGYAAYLASLCIWAKKTLMRELLGPDVFKAVVLTQPSLGEAQEVVLARLMMVVEHNQRDLIERRLRLNQGLAAMGLGVTLIGIALWYNSYRYIG